jgi:hypothetical protein
MISCGSLSTITLASYPHCLCLIRKGRLSRKTSREITPDILSRQPAYYPMTPCFLSSLLILLDLDPVPQASHGVHEVCRSVVVRKQIVDPVIAGDFENSGLPLAHLTGHALVVHNSTTVAISEYVVPCVSKAC